MFLKHFLNVFVTFLYKVAKNILFPSEHLHQTLFTSCPLSARQQYIWSQKKLKLSNVCICSDIFEENALQNGFCWCLEPNLEKDSLFIFMKSSKISSKSDTL